MSAQPATRFVVALDIAGTAHVVVAARDPATAIKAGFDVVRRPDIQDWWPRRQTSDFIAPHAEPYRTGGRSFEVGLPIAGTAYVTVDSANPADAIAAAYAQIAADDIDDWRAVRVPAPLNPPSVALEADTHE